MAIYFTGPNASDYLGYVEAENRRRAAQAATTNQLISDIARTAVARDRASNELTLGQGSLANDRYGMDNRSAMLDRELANRTAMSNSANELARYMHANASGSVMEQGKTARELETARSAADQERLGMQLAQQYQLSGDAQNTNLAVARMGAVASILPNFMAQAPDSRTWDAVMAENRSRSEAAQTANADLIKETGSILPSFLGGGDANAVGRTKHVADKGLTNRYDSAGLKFNATTGLYEAVPIPVPSRQGSPDAVNQLLRWGNMVPSGIGLPAQSAAPTPVAQNYGSMSSPSASSYSPYLYGYQQPAPAPGAAPVGRDIGNGIKRFGPAEPYRKPSGFVPAQDNPVAAPPQQLPPEPAPYYGPPKPRASARTPMTGIPEIDNAAATARSADLMSSADAQVAAARRRTAGMQSEYDALKNQLARNIYRAKNPDATRMYDSESELDPIKRVTVVNQLLQRMRELEGPLGIAYQ
jgi:hypothetical protein